MDFCIDPRSVNSDLTVPGSNHFFGLYFRLSPYQEYISNIYILSFDIVSGSDTTPCIKIDKQLVVYLYSNVACIMKKS